MILRYLLQLTELLKKQYSLPQETAAQICKNYLKMFRKCPDNCSMSLHEWRQILWRKALGDNYQHLSSK